MDGDIEGEELMYEPVPEEGFARALWALIDELRRTQAIATIE